MTDPGPHARPKPPRPLKLDVHVPAESRSYPVLIGRGAIGRLGAELQQRLGRTGAAVALVTDSTVAPLLGAVAQANLEAQGFSVVPIVIPAGEAHKTTATLLEVLGAMIVSGMGRRDAVVALGGGVVGDLSGLAAAMFMRGVPVVQCPTTLLAQVDASVGGKVAVDVPAGKNMVGAFHFPICVLIDPEVLSTLTNREIGQGLAEMLKHALLFSPDHFDALLAAAEAIYARDFDVITPWWRPRSVSRPRASAATRGRPARPARAACCSTSATPSATRSRPPLRTRSRTARRWPSVCALRPESPNRKASPSRASRTWSSMRSRAYACRPTSTGG